MSALLIQLRKTLRFQADPKKAEISKRFFKTGKGAYAQGDRFLGVTVPQQRRIAKQFPDLTFKDLSVLLNSPIHEERLTAILILVEQFKNGNKLKRKAVYEFYLKKAARINNWDLVDVSAYHIVGAYLDGKYMAVLTRLAHSKILWKRRIAIVATFYDIQKGRSQPTLMLAEIFLKDKEDLMHKATGWMLREVGKRVSSQILEDFLCRFYKRMPRTMLRYSIERLPPHRRKVYLSRET